MKKIIQFGLSIIAIGIMTSSCKQNMSITKRHYTKGYYVSYDKKNKTNPVQNKQTEMTEIKPENLVQKKNELIIEPKSYLLKNEPENLTILASNNLILPKIHLKNDKPELFKTKNLMIFDKKFDDTKLSVIKTQNAKAHSTDGEDALSLFWLVVVVLIILWAFGFLFLAPTGYLIHLLLVVALVLFILWLLRII